MSETRTRTYSWQDPLALRDEMVARSGLELMQLMAAGELSPPPIAETLGFRLVEAERGHAVFECQPAEYHYNPIGIVHAGLAMTLMDSAMGLAFVTTLDEPVGWTTLEVKTNFTQGVDRRLGRRAVHRLDRPSRPPGRDHRGTSGGFGRDGSARTGRARSSSSAPSSARRPSARGGDRR